MFPILLLINVVLCEAEWIKISQIPTSEFQRYTTPSTVDATAIVNGDAPIKYEDLEHIIGPGFEDELEKFYQRHKNGMERKWHKDRPTNKDTVARPATYEEDPWSVYDNPVHISVLNEPINVADVGDSEQGDKTMLNDKNRYEEYHDADHVSGSSNGNHESVTSRPIKNRYEEYEESVHDSEATNENYESGTTSRPIKNRYEEYDHDVHDNESSDEDHENRYEEYDDDDVDHASSSSNENFENITRKRGTIPKVVQLNFIKSTPTVEPFSFGGFIKFLRNMQSTFVTKTARSIKDKIETLEHFRDDILINIRMLTPFQHIESFPQFFKLQMTACKTYGQQHQSYVANVA